MSEWSTPSLCIELLDLECLQKLHSRPPRSRIRTILVDGLKNSSLGHVIVVYADDIRVNSNFCQKYAK